MLINKLNYVTCCVFQVNFIKLLSCHSDNPEYFAQREYTLSLSPLFYSYSIIYKHNITSENTLTPYHFQFDWKLIWLHKRRLQINKNNTSNGEALNQKSHCFHLGVSLINSIVWLKCAINNFGSLQLSFSIKYLSFANCRLMTDLLSIPLQNFCWPFYNKKKTLKYFRNKYV